MTLNLYYGNINGMFLGVIMIMKFYDETGKRKDYYVRHPFNSGRYGAVYEIDGKTCLKNFYSGNDLEIVSVLKDIRDLKLDNFYEIYDLLFDINGELCGYTMKFYQDDDIDIMSMPTDYTIENLRKINASLKRLSEKKICAIDLKYHNTIMQSDKIIIIDTDLYYRSTCDESKIYERNKDALYRMFASLYYATLTKKYLITPNDDFYDLRVLFNQDDDIDMICKKLSRYKYPIDYIYKRGRI